MAKNTREKAAVREESADRRPRATAKHIRISSRKVKVVVDLIRGKKVDEALAILQFTPKIASPAVEKVLLSAIANAENNLDLDRSGLFVAECFANQGATYKRFHPHARGMTSPRLKRTSHITVILDQVK